MLSDGRRNTRAREFGAEMCRRIVAAGIPIWRGFCFVATLHPEIRATAYIWNREEAGAMRVVAGHDLANSPEFTDSPIAEVRRSREMMRRRLGDSSCPLDFPVLQQFKAEGGTDYVAIPMVRSDAETNAITFLTDRKGGFTDGEIAGLEYIAQALGLITELQSSRRIAKSLLDTYIGRRTGERVLSGLIRRGSGETIRAVIWDNDLRGFTALADALPHDALNEMLNEYFEIMAGAVIAEGGEVLKFIGDLRNRRPGRSRSRLPFRATGRAQSGCYSGAMQPPADRCREAGYPLRHCTAPGRGLLREYRSAGPARFYGNRPGGESRLQIGETLRRVESQHHHVREFCRGGSGTARESRVSSVTRRARTAGAVHPNRGMVIVNAAVQRRIRMIWMSLLGGDSRTSRRNQQRGLTPLLATAAMQP